MKLRLFRAGICVQAFGLAALLPGCAPGVENGTAALVPLDNFHAIKAGQAYRSALLDATTFSQVIEDYDIRTVINLIGEHEGEKWYDAERAVCEEHGVALVDIGVSAHELWPREKLLALYDAFAAAHGPILIHCRAGADRTGAAAAMWRMQVAGDDRSTAAQELAPAFGHFQFAAPEMDQLVAQFVADRKWIESEYDGS
jgi:protein tyrosine/serine phosphatase